MSNTLIALLLALGAGVWIYNFFMKQTGGLTQNALIVAGISAGIIFLIALFLMSLIPA